MGRISRSAEAWVLGLNYRLALEYRFPAALEDATAAYRWLIAKGAKASNIVIAGDSAGGGLSLSTLVALRNAADPLPAAAVCLSPWVDMEATGDSMRTNAAIDPVVQREGLLNNAKLYLGNGNRRAPLVSPLYADLTGLPPLLIQVGGSEVLLDDSKRLAERAKAYAVDANLEVWPDDPRVAAVRERAAGGAPSHRTYWYFHQRARELRVWEIWRFATPNPRLPRWVANSVLPPLFDKAQRSLTPACVLSSRR